jgi:two-component system response regulator FlrC
MPSKSILVVDDDEKVGNTLTAILTQAGYQVVNVRQICEAIDCLTSNSFDLVLLDPRKPDLGGHVFLSQLHIVYPRLPVLVLTAYLSINFAEVTECAGTRRYFLKPIEPEVLLDCIEDMLSRNVISKSRTI